MKRASMSVWEVCVESKNKNQKPMYYWTPEKIKKEAKKYSTRSKFNKKSSGAYSAAIRLEILDEVCSHMRKIGTKWTKEKIINKIKIYKYYDEFKKDSSLYQAAKRRNLIHKAKKLLIIRYKKPNYWTPEKIKKEAKKYSTRSKFNKKSNGAYNKARKLGILDKVCTHMKKVGNRFKRYLYAFEFPDKSVYVGLTYNYDRRYSEHMRTNKLLIKKTQELGHTFIMLNELFEWDIVGQKEAELIENYKSKNWKILNKVIAGSLGTSPTKWTSEKIKKTASKYNNRSEFKKDFVGAYNAARRLGILNKVCSHMKGKYNKWSKEKIINKIKTYKYYDEFTKDSSLYQAAKGRNLIHKAKKLLIIRYKKPNYWTPEKIKKEAKKYTNRTDFFKKSSSTYGAARRLNILDEVCSHMKCRRGVNQWTK